MFGDLYPCLQRFYSRFAVRNFILFHFLFLRAIRMGARGDVKIEIP